MLQDACRFLDKAPAVLRCGVQDAVKLALAHNDVHLAAEAGIGEQFLDIQQAAACTVDGVFGAARTEQGPRNGHFAVLDGQGAVGVVDGQRHVGPAKGRPARGAGENDVFHFPAAKGLGTLLPHNPGQGVHHVGLSGSIGANHRGNPRLEIEGGGGRE